MTTADRIKSTIRHRLGRDADGMTGAALVRAIAERDRSELADVLAAMVKSGEVIEEDAAHGGHRYRLRPRQTNLRVCDKCKIRRRRATGKLCGACLVAMTKETPVPDRRDWLDNARAQRLVLAARSDDPEEFRRVWAEVDDCPGCAERQARALAHFASGWLEAFAESADVAAVALADGIATALDEAEAAPRWGAP